MGGRGHGGDGDGDGDGDDIRTKQQSKQKWVVQQVACGRAHSVLLVKKELQVVTSCYSVTRAMAELWAWGAAQQGQLVGGF